MAPSVDIESSFNKTSAPAKKSLALVPPSSLTPFPVPGDLFGLSGSTYVTAQLLAQLTAYSLSDTIFSYSPESYGLDNAIRVWSNNLQKSATGIVPKFHHLDARPGAGSLILGYANHHHKDSTNLASVFLPSGTLSYLSPVLSKYIKLGLASSSPLVLHVSALDYDVNSGRLVSDYVPVFDAAKSLGAGVVASSSGTKDAQFSSFVATAFSKYASLPTLDVQDGLRGTRSTEYLSDVWDAADISDKFAAIEEDAVNSLKTVSEKCRYLWNKSNQLFLTNFAPYELTSLSANPSTVYVSFGSEEASVAQSLVAADESPAASINVRLYSPFLADEFLSVLPSSVSKIVVLTQTDSEGQAHSGLFSDVATAVRLNAGRFDIQLSELKYRYVEDVAASLAVDNQPSAHYVFYDAEAVSDAIARTLGNDPSVRLSHLTFHDSETRGEVTFSDISIDGSATVSAKTDFVFVGNAPVTEVFDVAGLAKPESQVVILGDAEKTSKVFKKKAAELGLSVYSLDVEAVGEHGEPTKGRTSSMVQQIVFWHLRGLSINEITSKIVFANGVDTELVAATVARLAEAVVDKALVKVSLDAWKSLELSSDDSVIVEGFRPVATTFGFAKKSQEEATAREVSLFDAARKVIFSEAYSASQDLRPDLPVKNFVAKVKVNERVTPSDYDRHIFHLELDITGTGLKYAIGEALGIHAPNDEQLVNNFIKSYGLNADDLVSVSREDGFVNTKTVYALCRDNLDLFGKPGKKFYEALVDFATDPKQKAALEKLVSSEGKDELKRRSEVDFCTYVDVLEEFDSARPPVSELVNIIAPLKRREYSIASSQKVHPNAVHLLIVVVDWVDSRGRKRYGQSSKYLSGLHAGAEVVVSVKPSVMKLPASPASPIIMAGLGTGLAPFKAFLEEKAWQKAQGHEIGEVYLFLGSRHQRQEYLYGELFEAYRNAGILTYIGAAFSRDQPQKIYIQDRIREAKDRLSDAFVTKKGTFYLCGPTWPVADISEALSDIVATEAAIRGETIDPVRTIEELKDTERYILEVY